MAYIINISIIQRTTDVFFVAEKAVWHNAGGGIWKQPFNSGGEPCVIKETLLINGTNTSGALRFTNDKGEYLVAIIGIHNDHLWMDVVGDLGPDDVLVDMLPMWYHPGPYCKVGVDPSHHVTKEMSRDKKLVDMNAPQRLGSEVEIIIYIGDLK